MTGKGRGQNKSKREEEARSRGFVGADRESWVDAALTRASRRLQKKRNRRAARPLPGQGQGSGTAQDDTHAKNHRPGERREKRYAGSEWSQKDQKQNRQQKRADHAVNDAELAARRGSRFILERDNPPVKPEMKAQ